jgi:hypothetical protein
MNIILGKTEVSLLNPPNEGWLMIGEDNLKKWTWFKIGRNSSGLIVLRNNGDCHPEFRDGMDLQTFCDWINSKL